MVFIWFWSKFLIFMYSSWYLLFDVFRVRFRSIFDVIFRCVFGVCEKAIGRLFVHFFTLTWIWRRYFGQRVCNFFGFLRVFVMILCMILVSIFDGFYVFLSVLVLFS